MEKVNYEYPMMCIVEIQIADVVCASEDTVLPEDDGGFAS